MVSAGVCHMHSWEGEICLDWHGLGRSRRSILDWEEAWGEIRRKENKGTFKRREPVEGTQFKVSTAVFFKCFMPTDLYKFADQWLKIMVSTKWFYTGEKEVQRRKVDGSWEFRLRMGFLLHSIFSFEWFQTSVFSMICTSKAFLFLSTHCKWVTIKIIFIKYGIRQYLIFKIYFNIVFYFLKIRYLIFSYLWHHIWEMCSLFI